MTKSAASRSSSRLHLDGDQDGIVHALRTHQVDAIVGERHVMLVRLKQAEEDLSASRNQLHALALRLLSIRDDERIALARELHDEFGQALTSLQLGLSWVVRQVSTAPAPVHLRLAAMLDTTTDLMQSVRDIAAGLRPGPLDELGLVKTLRATVHECAASTGLACTFTTNATHLAFNQAAALALYRIVQAALTNVTRHARASQVAVALRIHRGLLILTITDNGREVTRTQVVNPLSVGISGMRERTLALGGTFTLAGTRGAGSRLEARFPLMRVVQTTAP